MQVSSSQVHYNNSSSQQPSSSKDLAELAEDKLKELVEAGNLEAIKLAISFKPKSFETIC